MESPFTIIKNISRSNVLHAFQASYPGWYPELGTHPATGSNISIFAKRLIKHNQKVTNLIIKSN